MLRALATRTGGRIGHLPAASRICTAAYFGSPLMTCVCAHCLALLALVVAPASGAAAFRNEVQSILRQFDTQLHAALQAVLMLTAATSTASSTTTAGGLQHVSSTASMLRAASMAPDSPSAAAVAAAGGPFSGPAAAAVTAAGKQRASELEAYAQQHCLQEVQQLAARLEQQLQQLPMAMCGVQGAATVEQVLILARLCSALATQSCMLPAVLGPPDSWAAAVQAGPTAGPPGSGTGSTHSSLPPSLAQGVSALGPAAAALLRMHHPGLAAQGHSGPVSGTAALLASLQQQLHGIACGGYALWARWVSSSFAAELAAALAADELLHSDSTPLAWTETKLSTESGAADADSAGLLDLLDDAAAAGGDMCFALPACPSAAVLQVVSRACWVSVWLWC